ncbi:MAG: hypothetical protein U9N85_09100 [Bacteroidota bacterium]|nr:hypothetical protein [Bacteroidota bacterium]
MNIKIKPIGTAIFLLAVFSFSSCKIKELPSPISSSKLTQQYYLYENRVDRRYYNERIQVQGIMSQVTRDKNNNLVVILARKNDAYGVKCIFSKSASQHKTPLELQHRVVVEGKCRGIRRHVILENCKFIEN